MAPQTIVLRPGDSFTIEASYRIEAEAAEADDTRSLTVSYSPFKRADR